MRRVLVLAVLLLAACKQQGTGGNLSSAAASPQSNLAAPTAESPEAVEERVRTAMDRILQNGRNLSYSNLRGGAEGAACGTVDLPGRSGKPDSRLFVVVADGSAVISKRSGIAMEDPEDPFPDLYIRLCATPQELATLAARVREAPPPPAPPPLPSPEQPIPQPAPADVPSQAAAPAAPPPSPAPPQNPSPSAGDNFLKAVKRAPH
jgi:hypothetical protein